MSDGSLSQDEIDALLQGDGGFGLDESAGEPAPAGSPGLSDGERTAFASIVSGISDTLSSNLAGLVGSSVTFGSPVVEVVANGSFVASLPEQIVQIEVAFTGTLEGEHSLIFSPEIATAIAGLMMGQDEVELNEAALSALEEAGNTLTGAEATAFSESIGGEVGTAPASSKLGANGEVSVPDGSFVKATYQVTIEGQPPAEVTEVFGLSVAKGLTGGGAVAQGDQFAGGGGLTEDALGGMGFDGGDLLGGGGGFAEQQGGGPSVQAVQFPGLTTSAPSQEQGNISLLMDVYMEMTVELGRTKKLIRDILSMGEGNIIELDKLAGEPVDILVNHKLIAKGEVVVIDENFGVRVTAIVDPNERMPEM